MKTYSVKPDDITRQWHLIDASEAPLGRIATVAATLLIGKGKPIYSHHIDCGDYVVITNAKELIVTGKKIDDKMYYRHSQYPGSIKIKTLGEIVEQNPTKAVFEAIRGMLPKNKLIDQRLKRLKIYVDGEHNNIAQKPKKVSIK